jgi:hypothetical protein
MIVPPIGLLLLANKTKTLYFKPILILTFLCNAFLCHFYYLPMSVGAAGFDILI